MSLASMFKGKGESGFGYRSTARDVTEGLDLSGKTYLLTGCNSGLGLETLRVLTERGGHVIGTARTEEKATRAVDPVSDETTPIACELSEPDSVRQCVDAVRALDRPLDGIICNAGIMALPKLQQKLGYELQFFTNHIGHFILVTGLLDALSPDGRVVIVSSDAHHRAPRASGIELDNLSGEHGYAPWTAYGQSKLANILMAKKLARRFAGTDRTANAVHPGVIRTNLARHLNVVARAGFALVGPLFTKSVAQGAATQCYLAAHPDVGSVSGQYFVDCNPARPSRHAQNEELADRLWEVSEEIVASL